MKQIATLQLTKYRRLYNDVLRRKLEKSNIKYVEQDIRGGYKLMVNENDFSEANRIVLSVSHTNPKY
jgi:hypothetical protein